MLRIEIAIVALIVFAATGVLPLGVTGAFAHEPILTEQSPPLPAAHLDCALESGPSAGHLAVSLDGDDLAFVLDLQPFRIARPGAQAVRITAEGPVAANNAANLYRGRVRGVQDSSVAVTIQGGAVDGLARIGEEIFLFVPADLQGGCEVDVHRLSMLADELPVADALSEMLAEAQRGGERILAGDQPFVLEYAVVGDFEWFERWQDQSIARMQSVINDVDAIFVDQMNITIDVSHSEVFETSADPFSEFNSGNLFANFRDAATEFGAWRDATGGPVEAAGLAHLFSDKALGLTSGGAGFGFIDTLCDADRGVSISTTRFFDSIAFSALIVAHELGHNFGSPHDGEGACASAPGGFIMAASATGSEFSDCSKDIMTPNAEAAACIVEGSAPICSQPASTGQSPTATDCLFILNAAVGLATCDPECICAPNGSLPPTASSALLCLNAAVGVDVTLNCPC